MAITAPDVEPQPVPGFRAQPAASTETFGGGPGLEAEGQQVQKVAADVGDIAAFEKIRSDQTAVEEAQAKGSRLSNEVLYDPQSGILTSKGTNALLAQKEGMRRLQQGMNDISQDLKSPQQVGAFNKWALDHVAAADKTVMSHVDQQLKDHDSTMYSDLLNQTAGSLALAHGNKDTMALGFQTVNDNAMAYAGRNRLDPDQTKKLVQDGNDKLHTAVIDGLTKFQTDDSAQKYFDENKDKISPEAQEKITVALNEHNIRWKSASAAQAIMKSSPDSEADALKMTEKISNPEVQDSARKLISARFSENRQSIKNDQDDTFMKMNLMVNQKGLTDPIDRRMAVPPMAWNKMTAEQQRAIEKGGTTEVTSPRKWLDLMQTVKDGNLGSMSRADLESKYLPYFDAADQKRASDMWGEGQKGKGSQRLMDDQNMQKMIDTALVGNGFMHANPKARTSADHDFAYRFGDAVHRDYISLEGSLKRNLKPEEVQGIVDKQVLASIGNKNTPLSTIAGRLLNLSPTPAIRYNDIPEDAKDVLMAKARQMGKPVTKEQIENAYTAFQRKDRVGVEKAFQ